MTTRPEPPKPPTRYDVEWTTEASPLPTVARDLLYALARRMQKGSIAIPAHKAAISLNDLEEITGWSRRHVQRALNYLERRGIVTRNRPSRHDAQTKHARTSYAVNYEALAKLGTGSPKEARDLVTYGLGPVRRKPRAKKSTELGTASPPARDMKAHSQTLSENSDQSETALVIKHLEERTGVTVSEQWAADTAAFILARPGIKNRMAYLVRTIATDKNPQRWLPTPVPPPYKPQQEEAS